ncbi:uncharacterized protein LOC143300657 [Babylonia areolata]|uniref:uncharacterized protein LOC143300657 n=1 Tax=Babylonia areolata TaxID=304850 RepID=UPI003FD65CE6
MMGMPTPMSEPMWYFYKQKLHLGAKRAADKHLQDAANQVRRTYADMNTGLPDSQGILNVSVSIDGSWQKRGHSSHNGLVTVIDIITGLITDFVALSNFCQVCETGPKPDDERYADWMEQHQDKCQKNINCSSGAMEMEGAVRIFQRSVELHGFRYTEMLGDGDAKTYKCLTEADPYDGYPIEKIDCVNHVVKRMGTALRNLVQKRKAQIQSIGGRGKLTDVRIKQLTNYYGRAIKDNAGDLEAMQRAVWASFFQALSNDESHNHSYCPEGTSSWCFFNRAIASNTQPDTHKHPLPAEIGDALKPIYHRLGDPQLLRRCLAGKTQNSNESFHSLMWSVCPKERWANLRTVDTALAITIQKFNQGSSALLCVLAELELLTTTTTQQFAEEENVSRLKSATRKSSAKEKEKRKKIDAIRRRERQDQQEREGLVYGAGEF